MIIYTYTYISPWNTVWTKHPKKSTTNCYFCLPKRKHFCLSSHSSMADRQVCHTFPEDSGLRFENKIGKMWSFWYIRKHWNSLILLHVTWWYLMLHWCYLIIFDITYIDVTWCYIDVTSWYVMLHWWYLMLIAVTWWILRAWCYLMIQGDTWCYFMLTWFCLLILHVARCYFM